MDHWWWFMTSGPFLLDDVLKRLLGERHAAYLTRIPRSVRRNFEIALMVFGVFFAGFLAFQDEHNARVRAENDHVRGVNRLSAARLEVPDVGLLPIDSGDPLSAYRMTVTYQNKGSIAATIPLVIVAYKVSKEKLSSQEETEIFNGLHQSQSQNSFDRDDRNEVQPGQAMMSEIQISIPREAVTERDGRQTTLYAMVTLKYDDAELPKGKYWYTEFCQYMEPKSSWRFCNGHNRIYLGD